MDGESAYRGQEHSDLSALAGAETLSESETLGIEGVGRSAGEVVRGADVMENPPPP